MIYDNKRSVLTLQEIRKFKADSPKLHIKPVSNKSLYQIIRKGVESMMRDNFSMTKDVLQWV